jgi:hypothetical protein
MCENSLNCSWKLVRIAEHLKLIKLDLAVLLLLKIIANFIVKSVSSRTAILYIGSLKV